jgi:anti-anti-sigma regulatory factor|tara:strand:+ start:234 stop:452 length:219 start_codon:yes stop_codon:yes gene_type:complete
VKEFVLVISMWGHTGIEWVFIGNQSVFKQTFSQTQCEQLANAQSWNHHNNNKHYKILFQCYPALVNKKDESL